MYNDEFELTFDLADAGPKKEQRRPTLPEREEAAEAAPLEQETREIPASAAPEPEPEPVGLPQPAAPAANGRTVLISGGDRGIGAAAARAFYAAGYRVAVFYHTNAEAAAALEKELPGVLAVQCDVASRASCELAFRAAEQALGRVDVLVSNAGIAQQKLFTDITPEEWQRMLNVNLTGAFNLCQLALPGMIRRKAGRILTVSSMWGQTGGSCEVHYSAAKAGLIGHVTSLLGILWMLFNRNGAFVLQYLELPAWMLQFVKQPWSLLTYMFMHKCSIPVEPVSYTHLDVYKRQPSKLPSFKD